MHTAHTKKKFSIKAELWANPQSHADLFTFMKEILNEKLHFLYKESFTG